MNIDNLQQLLIESRKPRGSENVLNYLLSLKKGGVRAMIQEMRSVYPRQSGYCLWRRRPIGPQGPEQKRQLEYFDQGYCLYRRRKLWIFGMETPLQATTAPSESGLRRLASGARIDLLAVDDDGRLAIIELKDPSKRHHPTQGVIECALYSCMVAACRENIIAEALKVVPTEHAELRSCLEKAKHSNALIAVLMCGRARRGAQHKQFLNDRYRRIDRVIRRLSPLIVHRCSITSKTT
ncbi:MAG: hypothetical protein HY553_14660 [Elusimicrobia bacterium]|nr:hypothetical protein [Elusimicrobiota bacterium]